MLPTMPTDGFLERDDRPVEDHIVVLTGATWADYQRLLELRGERAVPRLAYLEGDLQLMTPSRSREILKSAIRRLVEAWCLDNGVEFNPYGCWTLESKQEQCGVEPDECYIFGLPQDAPRPDLAIEVVWTAGGIAKLDIYRKLGVREVWFWRRGRITVHALRGEAYQEIARSELLPALDLAHLVGFLIITPAIRAIREYRASLAKTNG